MREMDSERKFRDFINFLDEGYFYCTKECLIIEHNEAFNRILGIDIGKGLKGTKLPCFWENPDDEKEHMDELTAKGFTGNCLVKAKTAGGEKLSLMLNLRLVNDESGNPVIIEGVFEDFTESEKTINELREEMERDNYEQKKSEKALKNSEEKYRSLIENLNEGIWLIDTDSITTFANKKMAEMLGYAIDEMIGKPLFYFMDEKGKAIAEDNVERRKKGVKEQHNFEFIKKDGSRLYALLETAPILDEKGGYGGALAGVIDISAQKELEEEKERIQNQLFQMHKMESIGILAGGVAHDFNNLMTVIIGSSDIAMAGIDKDNIVYEDLDLILRTAERAAELTSQLLLFSSKEPLKAASISLNSVIEDISVLLNRIIGEDIEIKMDLQPDIWDICADKSRISQVLMNMSVNAREAMPDGGILTIRTENVTLTEELSRNIPEAYPGRFVKLTIQDNGTGMNSEVIRHIFEPFFTTKGKGKGTGLGLSVAYGIVKQHKGRINVHSEPGNGTVFDIYFPAFPGKKEHAIKEKVKQRGIPAGQGERILVIEDEEGIRRYVNRALLKNGYKVFLAGNAKEALEAYEKENGNFRLVISDVVLPDMPGTGVVTQLLTDKPELKVIFISGYLEDRSQKKIIQDKGHKFLQKPFKLKELIDAVKEVLG